MGYEALIQDLERNARDKREEILKQGHKEASGIISDAEREVEDRRRQFKEKLTREVRQDRRTRMDRARVEARSILLQARVSLVDEVFLRLEDRLRHLPEENDYPELLRRLYREVRADLWAGPVLIRSDSKGIAFLKKLVNDRKVRFEILPEEELGGIELLDETGSFRILNTIKARLVKAKPEMLVKINRWIAQYE